MSDSVSSNDRSFRDEVPVAVETSSRRNLTPEMIAALQQVQAKSPSISYGASRQSFDKLVFVILKDNHKGCSFIVLSIVFLCKYIHLKIIQIIQIVL